MSFTYAYPRPMVTVDLIIFADVHPQKILLIERKNEPFAGLWALPGGFIEMEEDLHQSAQRELAEETGLTVSNLHQFKTYGTPNRDPRGRTITIVYTANLASTPNVVGMDDAKQAKWFETSKLPALAFDHATIIQDALDFYSS